MSFRAFASALTVPRKPRRTGRLAARSRIISRGGEVFAFEVRVPTDMVAPPAHLHAEEERLEVLEGEVTVRADGRQEVLRAGEGLVWRPGVAHTWWNSGPGDLRFRAEFRPAGNVQSFFETYCGLAAEGRSDEKGQPPLLQVAAECGHSMAAARGPSL